MLMVHLGAELGDSEISHWPLGGIMASNKQPLSALGDAIPALPLVLATHIVPLLKCSRGEDWAINQHFNIQHPSFNKINSDCQEIDFECKLFAWKQILILNKILM